MSSPQTQTAQRETLQFTQTPINLHWVGKNPELRVGILMDDSWTNGCAFGSNETDQLTLTVCPGACCCRRELSGMVSPLRSSPRSSKTTPTPMTSRLRPSSNLPPRFVTFHRSSSSSSFSSRFRSRYVDTGADLSGPRRLQCVPLCVCVVYTVSCVFVVQCVH